MTRRRISAVSLLLVVIAAGVGAQQRMTNVAVVDITKIQTVFYTQSARFKEFNAFKDQYQKDLEQRKTDIGDLQIRRADANRASNQTEVNRLDTRIAEAQAEMDTFIRLKEQERVRRLNDLLSTDAFFKNVRAATQWVCNQEGYALALTVDHATLLWWDPQIDITEKVINRMTTAQ